MGLSMAHRDVGLKCNTENINQKAIGARWPTFPFENYRLCYRRYDGWDDVHMNRTNSDEILKYRVVRWYMKDLRLDYFKLGQRYICSTSPHIVFDY